MSPLVEYNECLHRPLYLLELGSGSQTFGTAGSVLLAVCKQAGGKGSAVSCLHSCPQGVVWIAQPLLCRAAIPSAGMASTLLSKPGSYDCRSKLYCS